MRRTLLVLTVGILVALLLATPVLAAKQGAPRFFSLTGTIKAVDETAPYEDLKVVVLDGNQWVQQYIGNAAGLQVLVTEDTKYWQCTGGEDGTGKKFIGYGDLHTNDAVYIHGTYDGSAFTAIFIVQILTN